MKDNIFFVIYQKIEKKEKRQKERKRGQKRYKKNNEMGPSLLFEKAIKDVYKCLGNTDLLTNGYSGS